MLTPTSIQEKHTRNRNSGGIQDNQLEKETSGVQRAPESDGSSTCHGALVSQPPLLLGPTQEKAEMPLAAREERRRRGATGTSFLDHSLAC